MTMKSAKKTIMQRSHTLIINEKYYTIKGDENMESFEFVYWDHNYNKILLFNLAIAIGLFASLRFFSGVISHINPSDELLKKDNPAFGISMAGVVFAVTIVLTGAIYGDPIYTLEESVIAVGLYGIFGVLLMGLTRIIFDKIALPNISIRDEIIKGNVAAAIIDAGNVIATALIIRTMMVWVEANTIEGILAVLSGYVISQVLLTATTILRTKHIHKKNGGKDVQEELAKGNVALALRFSGRKIGTAFAITAASNIMIFEYHDISMLLVIWAASSMLMIAILSIISFIANKLVLFHIDLDDEVINRKNIALGAVQCALYISIGLLLAELMA